MLSIAVIRKEPDNVRQALLNRGEDAAIDRLLSLDGERRVLIQEGDSLRSRRNEVSRRIGISGGKDSQLIQEMRRVGGLIKGLEQQVKNLDAQRQDLLLTLPNLPQEDVPVGQGEQDNVVVRSWGQPGALPFTPLPHWELGERLGIIDFQRGVKLSGSRFYVLKGAGARLERALINWMLDLHTKEHGYQEVQLPLMVKQDVMVGAGQLPKFADNMYRDDEDDLWLIPTAEVPLTGLHGEEILSSGTLPLRYVSFTVCFRREKAAAGRDTRGIKRVHQFNKVELYKMVKPERSEEELECLVADAEEVCQRLGLAYRVLKLCTAELGFASAKSYDIEMWAPGSEEWLEVSSCSNCTDFQARRSNIRYRSAEGDRPQHVHTLNGSGLALPRVVISILESFQQEDGSVVVPEVLRPYTGFDIIQVS